MVLHMCCGRRLPTTRGIALQGISLIYRVPARATFAYIWGGMKKKIDWKKKNWPNRRVIVYVCDSVCYYRCGDRYRAMKKEWVDKVKAKAIPYRYYTLGSSMRFHLLVCGSRNRSKTWIGNNPEVKSVTRTVHRRATALCDFWR